MPSEPNTPRSANSLADLAMKYAGDVPTKIREFNEGLPTAAVDAGRDIFSKLPPEWQKSLSEAASAGEDALHNVVTRVAASPVGQAIGAGLHGIDTATKPLQENYAATQQMMKDTGVRAPSIADNPLFDFADVGPIGGVWRSLSAGKAAPYMVIESVDPQKMKLMTRPQMAMRAPDVPKPSKNVPITQSDPIINTAGSYDLLESTTPTGWSVYPVKRGTKSPRFKNDAEAQTAIDAYETQLIAKYGEDDVLQFPVATYTGGFADLEFPTTKMSPEEVSNLRAMHHARDMFSQRDMQDAQNIIKSRISAVAPEAVENVSPLFDSFLKRKALDEAMGHTPSISESEYRRVIADVYSRLAKEKWPGAYDLHDVGNAEMLWRNGAAGVNPTPLIDKAQDIVNSVFRGEQPATKVISSGKAHGGPVKGYAKDDLISMYNKYHDTNFKDRAMATIAGKRK